MFSIGTTGVTFPRPNQAGTNVHVVACAAGGGGGGGYGSFNGSSWSQADPGGGGRREAELKVTTHRLI